ncbi:MAG: alpha-L-fucosidase [Kiritimatiellia bacterium]
MMKRVIMLSVVVLATAGIVHGGPESLEERNARMKWWREAHFGMFVHWGLYSGLAGTWKGRKVGDRGGMEWLQYRVKADTWEYAHEAFQRFHPAENFAEEWARLAREAGCRYVVFTSKHHDGFNLHDSSVTTYDAKDWTGRDLCREIVDACKKQGLKVGFYHSVIDWHHPQYDYNAAKPLAHPLKDQPFPAGQRNHALYLNYLHHQVEELMSNYGGIDIIWWDFSKKGAEGAFWRADELMSMVRKYQPGIISNNRLYHITKPKESSDMSRFRSWDTRKGDYITPEQHVPDKGLPGVDWEVCMTLNTTWGYSEHDHAWKSDETLIRNLVDIVSKGGNYLLNIGPKADGSVPAPSLKSMQAIGRWMKVNSESIYATSASPFEKPAWGRYTSKPGVIYAHVFDWPENGRLVIPAKDVQTERASLLAGGDPLPVKKSAEGIVISLPAKAPDAIVSVVKIECD